MEPKHLAQLLLDGFAMWREEFGETPDCNVLFRSGAQFGHLLVEMIPRAYPRTYTRTKPNIEAGFELSSSEWIITVDPKTVAAALKAAYGACQHRRGEVVPSEVGIPNCLFCNRRTPSTLLSVRRGGAINVPEESGSFSAAAEFLRGRDRGDIQSYYELVGNLASHNGGQDGDLVRVFANLTPALVGTGRANCVVVGLADPRYHGVDLPDLPVEVVSAYIRAFQFLEAAAERAGMTSIPFLNYGPAAGGTVKCPHGQVYLLDTQPPVFREVAARRASRGVCGVCETLKMAELAIV